MPSAGRRRSSAGVTSTIPTRDFANPLSIARSNGVAEANVLLAEPDRDTARLEQIVQLLGGPLPVVPRVAEKDVPKVRQGRSLLDGLADRRECPHLAGVYNTDEPARDQRGLALLPDPPPLLRPPPLLPDEE